MDAYTFLRIKPGLGNTVMNTLVETGIARRVVAVTGRVDLVGRIEDVSVDDLGTSLLERLGGIGGIKNSVTGFVVPPRELGAGNVSWTLPFAVPPPPPPILEALVFVKLDAAGNFAAVKAMTKSKAVVAIALLTGDIDLMVQVRGRNLGEIAKTVFKNIRSIPGVTSTSTSIILRSTPHVAAKTRTKKKAR